MTHQGGLVEQFVTSFGLPGAVILCLVGLIAWIVRKLFTGDIVTRREADDIRVDLDRWRTAAEVSNEQVTKMLDEEQTSTTVLRHIESFIRGDDR